MARLTPSGRRMLGDGDDERVSAHREILSCLPLAVLPPLTFPLTRLLGSDVNPSTCRRFPSKGSAAQGGPCRARLTHRKGLKPRFYLSATTLLGDRRHLLERVGLFPVLPEAPGQGSTADPEETCPRPPLLERSRAEDPPHCSPSACPTSSAPSRRVPGLRSAPVGSTGAGGGTRRASPARVVEASDSARSG